MKMRMVVLVAAILGMAASAMGRDAEVVARVEVRQRAGEKAVFAVGGKEEGVAQVAADVGHATGCGTGAATCEVVASADVRYEDLMAAFAAASQANILVVRITVGKDRVETQLVRRLKDSEVEIGLNVERADGKIRATVAGEVVKDVAEAGEKIKAMAKRDNLSVTIGADPEVRAEDVVAYAKAAQAAGVPVTFQAKGLVAAKAEAVDIIAVGTGETTGSNEAPAVYGVPKGGTGIGVKFYETKATAKKVVYIVDASAATGEHFDFLRQELARSVNNMIPVQFLDVVMLSEKCELAFAGLTRATTDTKREFAGNLSARKPAGEIGGKLEPFKGAFEKAFEMKPEVIYFLTSAGFDPELVKVVGELNKEKSVRVYGVAFVREDSKRDELLKRMAKENGGTFKYVSEESLGKQGRRYK